MLLELIARYYKFFWFAFIAITFLKIILSYSFNQGLEGLQGILYAMFKWYGEDEQEMEDHGWRRTIMRLHNIVTLMIYGILSAIFIATLFQKILAR